MKYCNKCGNKLKEGAKFCTNCGNKSINTEVNNSNGTSGKCPRCGADITGKKFCTACGYKVPINQSGVNAQVVDIKIDDSVDIEMLYKRAFMYLEDDKKNEAFTYFEHFLDRNPEDSRAYFGKLMIECGYAFEEDFRKLDKDISNSKNFRRAYKYGDDKLKEKLDGYILTYVKNTIGKINTAEEIRNIYNEILNNNPNIKDDVEKLMTEREAQIIELCYQQAVEFGENAKGKDELLQASKKFSSFNGYKDSEKLAAEYKQKSKEAENDAVYNTARRIIDKPDCTISALQNAIAAFESIKGWKDSQDYIEKCHNRIEEIKTEEETRRAEMARQEKEAAESKARAKKLKIRILIGIFSAAVLVIAGILVYTNFIKPNMNYDNAMELIDDGEYLEASEIFDELGDYKDSEELAVKCSFYNDGLKSMESQNYVSAIESFKSCEDFKDAKDKIAECENTINQEKYDVALSYMSAKKYEDAISYFEELGDFSDSKAKIEECNEAIEIEKNQGIYDTAKNFMSSQDYGKAIYNFEKLGDYSDSKAKIEECNKLVEETYNDAEKLFKDKKYSEAKALYKNISYYNDSKDKANQCDEEIKQLEYDEALKLMNNGEYEKAKNVFNHLGNFKDSKEKVFECEEKLIESKKDKAFEGKIIIDDGYLNVRAMPDLNSDVIGKLNKNDIVTVSDYDGEWAYITKGNISGYVYGEYLQCAFIDYIDIMANVYYEFGEYNTVSLYDIDKDGTTDMIIELGYGEADARYEFYTATDYYSVFCGQLSASHAWLLEDDDGTLLIQRAHMGGEGVSSIEKNGYNIIETELYSAGPVEEYSTPGEPIETMTLGDIFGW